ncbi:MAG TPA: alpha/beta hydrolase [Candidatus Paceibacterota bacterium]|nr:alpha/beta hydrolase [Verrucomicrobiota bacterium]HRZ44379.1 alpha/beta hydrolase [Candidatus Paceibacterota bacterium]
MRVEFCFCAATVVLVALRLPAATTAGDRGPALPVMPEGVRFEPDIEYLEPGRSERADLYLPSGLTGGGRAPAVVIIHGGGWSGGDKRAAREINIGTNLALHGYVGMSINYLLAAGGNSTWPTNLHDCKTAVRWLRKNADRLRVDPDRIGVIGGSAGGHLAAMLAVTGPDDGLDPRGPYGEFSCRVQCAVDLYGPADLLRRGDTKMLGKTRAEAPELYRAASPTAYADASDPPILILHGTADKTVDLEQSELFAEALKRAGARHELVVVEGAPHTFHLQPKQRDLRPQVLGFFDAHLKGGASAGGSTPGGAAYHVDSAEGDDANSGALDAPWKTLARVNGTVFEPGDKILFKGGCSWIGQLNPKGSGTAAQPIVIDRYGGGPMPVIDGGGAEGWGAVCLFNQAHWEINSLEIRNDAAEGGDRRGVYLSASNFVGTVVHHLHVRNCRIHHIKGLVHQASNAAKRTGGIVVEVIDDSAAPTRFNDILIENCDIATVDNQGIALNNRVSVGDYPGTPAWEARKFTQVVIRGNSIHDVAKNAMIIRLTDETGLVERNVCWDTAYRAYTGNTIFSRSCRGTVFQYNEGYRNRAGERDPSKSFDGSLYDADLQSPGCVFQYSYSHDNAHGLYWQCTDARDTNLIVRYNISQNDRGIIFCMNYGAASTLVYNNTVFIGPHVSPAIIDERRKAAKTYSFFNNVIYNQSANARYRWFNGSRTFDGNLFFGFHPAGEPDDPRKLTGDPRFVNPGSGGVGLGTLAGYMLQAGSPCIDSGTTVPSHGGRDFWGSAVPFGSVPDRGAHEWNP